MVLWKKLAIGLGVLAVLGGLAGGAAFVLTAGTAEAATAFVKEIAEAGPEAAYKDAAPALRLSESGPDFAAQVRHWRLTEVKNLNWPSRSFQNGRVTLTGTATLQSGETLPLRVGLVKVGSKWAVSSVALDAGAQSGAD